MRALVFANGEIPSRELVWALREGADLVVAADGGADKALAGGIEPDAVVGDLDSASTTARERMGEHVHRNLDPNTTDLQKAIAFAIEQGATEVDVVAAGGGRADHAFANLSMVILFRGQARVRLIDDLFEVSLVEGEAVVEGKAGTVVSLVAVGECRGVTTSGLRWNLADHDLGFSPLGVHNEIVSSPARVSVRAGDLLLFRGRFVEKHG